MDNPAIPRRVYTKKGFRAHYARPATPFETYCERFIVPLSSRQPLARRILVHASVCGRCEKAQEIDQLGLGLGSGSPDA